MQNLFLIILVILLSACDAVAQPTPFPVETIAFYSLETLTTIPSPTPTSTQVPPTRLPTPTADPNFFRDDFTGALDAQWSWVREDPLNWSITAVPDSLQINVENGSLPAHSNSNLLLRAAPMGNFQIETQITFYPTDNFQFAGLIIYESDSNFIQAGRAFCSAVGCIGEGLYMDYYRKGVVVKPNFGTTHKDIDPLLLRLSRTADTYSFQVSTDGNVWFTIGRHTSDITPTHVGLVAGQNLRGEILPAIFEYFEVRSLP